jgi:acid phosphatase type 7
MLGPYIQNVTSRSAIVCWYTDKPSVSLVKFRSDASNWAVARNVARVTHHEVLVQDLQSDTQYRYRIPGGASSLTAQMNFRTAPLETSARALRLAVIGDTGRLTAEQAQVVTQLERWRPELVLHMGDLALPSGRMSDYRQTFFAPFQNILVNTPFYPVIGNHDATNAQVYRRVFSLPAEQSSSFTELYYSFQYGPVHIVALDSSIDYAVNSVQRRWLEQDLASSQAQSSAWRLVFLHIPPFSCQANHPGGSVAEQTVLVPLFERYRVNVVFSGHDHLYAQSAPFNLYGATNHNVLYIVSGGGGQALSSPSPVGTIMSTCRPRYHFVELKITPVKIIGRAIGTAGQLLSSFSVMGK